MSAGAYDKAVRELVPLHRLPRAAQNAVIEQARLHSLGAGAVLCERGEREPCCHYLLSGTMEFVVHGHVIKEVTAGERIAARPLNRQSVSAATLRARDACTVFSVERALVEQQVDLADAAGLGVQNGADWLTRLMRSGLPAHLPAASVRVFLAMLREQLMSAGEVVLRQGEPGDAYYVVREGRCRVSRRGPDGRSTGVADLGPGEGFGEEALITGRPRNATVTMLTDGRLMRLEKPDFLDLIGEALLRGLDLPQARALERRGAVWLDLRPPEAFARAALPGSLNLPSPVLRQRAGALAPEERYILLAEDPLDARVGAFLLGERGFDAVYFDAPAETLLAGRTLPSGGREAETEAGFPSLPPLAGEGPEAVQARESLQERTAPPAFEFPPATEQADAVAEQAAPGKGGASAVEALEQSFALEPGTLEPPPASGAAEAAAALLRSVETRLRATLDEHAETLRRHYEQSLERRTERLREQAAKELLRRDAEREAQLKASYAEKEQALRQHYRKLIELASRLGNQREQLQAAREQLKQRLQQSNELQREVHQMRSVLAQSLDELESGQPPSDKVLNRSIRTLLTG